MAYRANFLTTSRQAIKGKKLSTVLPFRNLETCPLVRLENSLSQETRKNVSLDVHLNRNYRFQNKYTFLYCVFKKAVTVRKQREAVKKEKED